MSDSPRRTHAERVDAELEALYAQVPAINCKGLCGDACGPVYGGHREVVRLRRAGVHLPPPDEAFRIMATTPGNYRCPALTDDDQCGHYELRPMVCRIWGASQDLPCPYGCKPTSRRLLTSAESQALLDAARKAGTIEEPITVEEIERRLSDPSVARRYRTFIPTPEATRPIPRKTKHRNGGRP